MKGSSSRRGILKGLVILSAGGAPAVVVAAAAAEPSADAALLALAQDYFRAYAAYQAAAEDGDRIRTTWEATKPPKPDALRREGDVRFFGAARLDDHPFYDHGDVEKLRKFSGRGYLPASYRDAAVTRAREIVAAHERWEKAVIVYADTCGLSASNRRCDEADDARSAIGEAVKAARPTTLEGFVAKARVGQVEGWPEFDAGLRDDLAAMGDRA